MVCLIVNLLTYIMTLSYSKLDLYIMRDSRLVQRLIYFSLSLCNMTIYAISVVSQFIHAIALNEIRRKHWPKCWCTWSLAQVKYWCFLIIHMWTYTRDAISTTHRRSTSGCTFPWVTLDRNLVARYWIN